MNKLLTSLIGLLLITGLEGKKSSARAQPYERAIERANRQAEQYREAQLARPAQMRAVLASQAYGRRLLQAEAAAEEENQRRQTAQAFTRQLAQAEMTVEEENQRRQTALME